MFTGRVHITDDRGERRELLAIAQVFQDPSASTRLVDAARRIRADRVRQSNPSGLDFRRGMGLVVLFVLASVGVGIVATLTALHPWVMPVGMGLTVSGLMIFMQIRTRVLRRAQAVNTLLSCGCCPSCGYLLEGLPVAEDQCVACTECSGAWKADRLARVGLDAPALPDTPLVAGWSSRQIALWHTTEAHGRIVYLADPKLQNLPPERLERIGPGRLTSLRRLHPHDMLRGLVGLIVLVWLIPMQASLSSRALAAGPSWSMNFAFDVLLGVWILWMAVYFLQSTYRFVRYRAGLNPDRFCTRLLKAGLCPSCAEPLDEVVPDQQQVSTCGACRSAWRRD